MKTCMIKIEFFALLYILILQNIMLSINIGDEKQAKTIYFTGLF